MVFNFRLNPRYIHKRSVSFHKFDLPVYLGKGNHDPELLPKIHQLQLIAFDFLNLISFVDVVLLSAAVLKSSPYGFATLDHEKNGMKKNCDTFKSFQTTSSIDRSIPLYVYLHSTLLQGRGISFGNRHYLSRPLV